MGQLTSKSIVTLLLCCSSFISYAQVSNDPKTTQAVLENTASQTFVENWHNNYIESVSKKMKAIAGFTTKMAAIKEAYRISMQNVDGFGQETQIYKEIATTTFDIAKNIPIAIKELGKRPYSSLICKKEILGLSLEATSAVTAFVNIVNNGKVSIKIKDLNIGGSNDGYNFLNRTDRYTLANSTLITLREIKYKLDAIIYMSRFCNGIGDLVYALDVETWYNYMAGKNQIETIINYYKEL